MAIVGSRRRASLKDRQIVFDLVDQLKLANPRRRLILVSGACYLGADDFAAQASRALGIPIKEFPVPKANYPTTWDYAKAAYARNLLIAQDAMVGFALVAPDRKGGTEDTVKHFVNLKKNIYLVDGRGVSYLLSMAERNRYEISQDPDKT